MSSIHLPAKELDTAKIRTCLLLFAVIVAALAAWSPAGSSAAHADPTRVVAKAGTTPKPKTIKFAQGEQWLMGQKKHSLEVVRTKIAKGGSIPDAGGWAWFCRGTFASPDLCAVAGFTWGAFQQCSEQTVQQVSVKIYLCVQDPGGPSQYHCDVFKAARKGALVDAYLARTNAEVKNCSRSKYSTHVQEAYSVYAHGEYLLYEPQSNLTEIHCGF